MSSTRYPHLNSRSSWTCYSIFTLVLIVHLLSCNNAGSSAVNSKSDSLKLAKERQDSTRKAAFKNHDFTIIFLEATQQMLQCQLLMERADAGGRQVGVADSLIVNSKKGDTLYRVVSKLYDVGALYATNETDKKRFEEMKLPDSSTLWLAKNFKGASTTEAVNTLNRFQHDCTLINKLIPH